MTPGFEEKQHHDAAFDAYMTGVVFARARHFIQYSSSKSIMQTENWLVESIDWSTSDIMHFANRICLNRCIQHLNLTSGDVPSFRGVLKVAIQESLSIRVRTSHIVDVLKPVIRQDRMKLLWDDDKTAFAILGAQFHDRLQWIATTVNNATRMAGFTVEPFYGI
ncbi:hypothetical protein BVRB_020650 [Beta vulgaris subsp. vulgaris]|uniref:Uncharacterized protein n=1 Tax=Beta vulgaris subsp. vulgaris TaxID=3555 RepID=A0A0J8B0L3_BETVV|nr:hypothetical protein BVRB_020650 [Beta vulgaris subsp. vulgaris]